MPELYIMQETKIIVMSDQAILAGDLGNQHVASYLGLVLGM